LTKEILTKRKKIFRSILIPEEEGYIAPELSVENRFRLLGDLSDARVDVHLRIHALHRIGSSEGFEFGTAIIISDHDSLIGNISKLEDNRGRY